MSEYIIRNGVSYEYDSDSLTHHGVKGMKWGVRRNTKRLQSSNAKKVAKGVKNLEKHRMKASNEISKLKKTNAKLQTRHENNQIRLQPMVAKLNREAAVYRHKASRRFISDRRAQKYINRAYLKEVKAKDLAARAHETKTKIEKNNMLITMFERGINDIDSSLANRGKKYLKG